MSLGTPTGLFHVEETAKTTDSVLTTSGAVPAGATVVLSVGNSILNNYAKRVTDNSGLGIVWRPIRVGQTSNTGGTPPNVAMYYAYCPAGLPSGTNITVAFSSATSMTRIFHALYMTGQARPDKSATTENTASVATWSMATADNTAFSSEVAIAACCNAGNVTSTDTSSPAMTEVYDTGATAASGNRGLTTQYLTGVSSGATVTASGSFSANARWIAVIVTFREYVSGNSYASEVSADSPTNNWHLDDTSGTTAVDSVGASNGTYVNTPTLGATGAFSGSGTSVTHQAAQSEDTTLPVSIPATFSFETWFKCAAISTAALRDNTGVGGHVYLLPNGLTYTVRVAGTTAVQPAAAHIEGGDWHHFVVTRTGTSVVVYIDGQKIGAGTGGAGASTSPFHLAKNGTSANFEDISVDETALYSTVLSWDRVRAHFDAGVSTRISAISQASETDSAGAITARKTVAVGRASETDTAGTVTTPTGHTVAVGRTTETDSAQVLTLRRTTTVAQATETDSATAVVQPKYIAVARATETDTAGALTVVVPKFIAAGRATETDSAGTISRPKTIAIGQAAEVDTARPITPVRSAQLGRAPETDSATTVTVFKTLGHPAETDTAFSIHSGRVAQALETDTAGAIAGVLVKSLYPEFTDSVGILLFQPDLAPGQELEPGTIVGSATVGEPSISVGQLLLPDTGPAGSSDVRMPVISAGQLLLPGTPASGAATVASPSLIQGQFLSPGTPASGATTVYDAALIIGQELVVGTPPTGSVTLYNPALSHGQPLAPGTPPVGSATVASPSLIPGQFLLPQAVASGAVVYAPALASGQALHPDFFANGGTEVYEPALEDHVPPIFDPDPEDNRTRSSYRTAR